MAARIADGGRLILPVGFPMIILWGLQLIQIYNDGYRDLMGNKHPAGLGRPTRESWPEVWNINAPIYAQVRDGETLTFEDALYPITRSGRLEDAWFTLSYSPLHDEGGAVAGVLVTVFETTERHLADRGRSDSEALRRVALEGGRMGAWRWDLDAAMIWGDAQFWTLWGYPPSDHPRPLSDFNHRMSPESVAHVAAVVANSIEAGKQFDGPLEIVTGPTAGHWLRWQGRADEHDPKLLYRVSFDITGQKQGEATARESEERLAFLLELSDALRPLTEAGEIERTATRLLGEHLKADRCFLSPVYEDGSGMCVREEYLRAGASSVLGDYTFAQFGDFVGPELHAGHILAVEDVGTLTGLDATERESYAATEIQAYLLVPLVRAGRLAAFLTINHRTPHRWSDADKAIARQTADRLWTAKGRSLSRSALRESEERQTFLLKLSDALRPIGDPVEAQGIAMRLLGEHLGADRAFYYRTEYDETGWVHVVDVDFHRNGMPNRVGRRPQPDFGRKLFTPLEQGKPIVAGDIHDLADITPLERASFEAVRIRAFVALPLMKDGRHVAGISVQSSEPREWLADEIALIDDVAQRTWSTVQRSGAETALRESQARLARELANSTELQKVSSLMIEGGGDEALYGPILDAAMAIMRADFASLQRYDPATRELSLLAHHNFHPDSAKAWERISYATGTPCGGALGEGERLFTLGAAAYDPEGAECFRKSGIGSCQSTPLTSRDGRLIGMISTHWRGAVTPTDQDFRSFDVLVRETADAFERTQALQALRESEERFREFGEASPDVLWMRDAETLRWTYLSHGFDRIYGLDRDKALTGDTMRNWTELIVPEDRERALECIARVQEGGRATFEYRIRRPADGQVRWIRNTDFPIRDSHGRALRIGGVGTDITPIKDAEAYQSVLLSELQQRVRNTLAVVRSIARRTADNSYSVDDMLFHFKGRIDSFSRVQSALARRSDAKVDLASLI